VKAHGGSIEVQSRLGEGSEFILRFPSATAVDVAGRLGLTPTPLQVTRVEPSRDPEPEPISPSLARDSG